MSVAGVIAEADADLAAVRSVLDSAQQALDVVERTQRTGARLATRVRTVAVVVAIGTATLGVALAVRAVLARRAEMARGPVEPPAAPDRGTDTGSTVAPGAPVDPSSNRSTVAPDGD